MMMQVLSMGRCRWWYCSMGRGRPLTGLPSSRSSRLHRWRGHPNGNRQGCRQGDDRSARQSCSERTSAMGSRPGRTRHTP